MMFGDARRAGERMNEGVDFKDLSPEERLGVRFFLLDILPFPGLGPATKSAQAAKAATQAQKQAMQQQITKGSVGAASTADEMIKQTKNTIGDITDEEIQYLATPFLNFQGKQRQTIMNILTDAERDKFSQSLKNKITPEMFPNRVKIVDGVKYFRNDGAAGKTTFLPEDQIYVSVSRTDSNPGVIRFNRATEGPVLLKNLKTKMNTELKDINLEDTNAVHNVFRNAYLKATGRTIEDSPVGKATGTHLRETIKKYNATNPEIKIPQAGDARTFRAATSQDKQDKFATFYYNNIRDKKMGKVVMSNEDPEYRFLQNLSRTTPNFKTPEEFFTKYKLEDVRPGGKLNDQFKQFEAIDKIRLEATNRLKPILQKIYTKVREGTPLKKDSKATFNLAHRFETQGIANKYVSPDKYGKGSDPTELYIDVSEYNSVLQKGYEKEARQLYLRYADKGNEADYQKLQAIDKEMRVLGIEGEIAPGQKIGGAMPIDQKISEIMIEAFNKGYITQTDSNIAERAANKIAKIKQDNASLFEGLDVIEKAGGGLIGDMIPVKANVGKFIKSLFGETPSYRKEGMDVTDLFGPTKKQKQTLEQLYPNKSFPETYPGEVFYSNFDLALSKRGAPETFQNEDSFRNYMNQSGVGTDELDDAKVIPYIKSKSQGGEQIFSQDLRRIANQSPIRSVFMDAYGFRSDKINQASRDIFDPNTGSRVQVEGQAVFKNPAYSGTAIMDGELANTYRERVFRVKKDKLRGDPGSVPGGADNHKFGGTPDTEGNYTLFWTRQTDRPAYIIPGEVVDKKTGDIISPAMLSDQTKLKGIEDRIQKLFADPIATLNPEDLEGVSATVKRLVDSSAGRLTSGKAYNVVMGQIDAKQKQIKRLQNEYNVEKERLDSFVSPQKKEIVTTMIDELQSDILQSLRTKSRNLAGKLKIMADRNMSIDSMRDKELLEYFQDTGGVVRPLGKTKEELLDQFNQLKEINKQLKESSQKFAFGITEGDLNYYNNVKLMQQQIINEMTNNISKDLMQKLYPDVPFKDRIQYADAAVKQSVAEAAHRLFIEKDPNAPKYISYMSGAQIKSNYNQPGGAATPAAERSADLDSRQRMFEQSFAGGNEGAVLEQSELRGIGTEEFYGGPDVKNEQGAHFTGVMENIFKKIANEYGSKMEIANVATQNPRVRDVYNIIDQDTGVVMGSGDTYRQAENIANDLVEEGGGRYRIATETERVYDSRPVFTMEITPEMLQLFKAYK